MAEAKNPHLVRIESKVDSALESTARIVGRLEQAIQTFAALKHTALWLAAGLVVAVWLIVKVL